MFVVTQVASRAWCGAAASAAALGDYLRSLHGLICLLHAPVSSQLDDDPSAVAVRGRLTPLLQEAASRLLRSDAGDAAALSCPLAARGGAPALRVSRPAFAALQALVNQQLVGAAGGGRLVHGVAACFGAHLLWSTLAPADTNALFALAARGVLPAVRAGPRHRTVSCGCDDVYTSVKALAAAAGLLLVVLCSTSRQ